MSNESGRILIIGSDAMMMFKFHNTLIRELLSRGWHVTIAAPSSAEGGAFITQLVEQGVVNALIPLSRNGLNPVSDLSSLLSIVRLMRRDRPDVVLAYTVKPVIYGLLAAGMTGVARRIALITGLGYAFTGAAVGRRRIIQMAVSGLYRLALRHASLVLFQNVDDQTAMRAAGLIPPQTRSQVIDGCGVDTDHFTPSPVPSGPPVFLMIARIIADKGVREFVAAARIVHAQHRGVQFRLVGGLDSNPGAISREEVEGWVHEGSILWDGPVDDVRPALAECSAFVLPSYREGLPQSTIEALAMGRAVITCDVPGCRETVIEGCTGFLVPSHSPEPLAKACLRLIADREMLLAFGRAGRQLAEERFSARQINTVMLGLISRDR